MLLFLIACSEPSAQKADYKLDLVPLRAGNQDPFAGLDRLQLVLEHEKGDPEYFDLSSTTGSPQLEGMGPLENTTIAVEGYIGDELVAFGRTTPITLSDGEYTESVLVAEVDDMAWLATLSEPRVLAAAAPDGVGSTYVFGGGIDSFPLTEGQSSTDTILRLPIAPPEVELAFVDTGLTLPEYTGFDGTNYQARMGMTATLLTGGAADAGKILVTGGNEEGLDLASTTYDAFLFDPATGEIETISGASALQDPRTQHLAVENVNGDVVIFGGFGGITDPDALVAQSTWEVYSRATRSFTRGDKEIPGVGIFGGAASLGTAGVLYCGGLDFPDMSTVSSVDKCSVVSNSGILDKSKAMPASVSHFAMVSLGSGKVLVTGGVSMDHADPFREATATDSAWIYDAASDTWTELDAKMGLARANHRAALLPDGKVLIVGGSTATLAYQPTGRALACAEVFDPATETFELLDGCSKSEDFSTLPSRTAMTTLSVDDSYGVVVIGGVDGSTATTTAALWVGKPGER